MIKKYFNRFPHALRGLYYALRYDFGFRTQVYLVVAVTMLVSIIFCPLTSTELIFLAFAAALICITELQNSALETALDRLHPELHDAIKHSKDMASASVLVAGLCLLGVVIFIGYHHVF